MKGACARPQATRTMLRPRLNSGMPPATDNLTIVPAESGIASSIRKLCPVACSGQSEVFSATQAAGEGGGPPAEWLLAPSTVAGTWAIIALVRQARQLTNCALPGGPALCAACAGGWPGHWLTPIPANSATPNRCITQSGDNGIAVAVGSIAELPIYYQTAVSQKTESAFRARLKWRSDFGSFFQFRPGITVKLKRRVHC
jgi:hypothetical protein